MSINTTIYHSDEPKYATTDGSAPWYNITYSASLPTTTEGPWNRTVLNPFETFSATCTYFAVGKETPPLALVRFPNEF
jgi:hypothetical protein